MSPPQRNNATKYFFSITNKSLKGDDGIERYEISSVNQDRDKDRMTDDFLTSAMDQINTGHVSMWADHGFGEHGMYSVYDKLGFWSDAIVQNGILYARPNFSDAPIVADKVDAIKGLIKSNTPISWSIGFIPGDAEENEFGGVDFKSGELLEVSTVGIPSNPDATSSIKNYIKLLKDVEKMTEKENKEVENLAEALVWLNENAPPEVTSMIVDALKEDDEDDPEDDPEDKPKANPDDEDDEDEDKSLTVEQIKALVAEEIKANIPKPAPEPEPEKQRPTPKGHGPTDEVDNNDENKSMKPFYTRC